MMDIRAEVANALHWDIAIPRHRVTADVHGGWVTLQGEIFTKIPLRGATR